MTNTTPIGVFIGVDTHKEVHAAAAISGVGAHLASTTVPASSKGYGALEAWAKSMGAVQAFGIEGTGSYGAGLTRGGSLRLSRRTTGERPAVIRQWARASPQAGARRWAAAQLRASAVARCRP